MSKIDILLPFWGDINLFKQTVQSVLSQSNPNWRLLIFDDCYPSEEPKKYIESISDQRITYYRHKRNIGITKNFNFALSKATAPYFIMLGCDDILLPSYVEISMKDIGSADFYQPTVQIINQNGDIYMPLADRIKQVLMPRPGLHTGEKLASSLCYGNWLYFPSILWRTDIVKKYKFNSNYKIAEDLFLELQLILDGYVLNVGSTPIFQYRRFSQSLSSKERRRGGVRFNEEEEVYNLFSERFATKGWKKAARIARIRPTSRLHKLISR